jgi:hypothetical protein
LSLCVSLLLGWGCSGGQGSGAVDCTGGYVSNGGCVLTTPERSVRPGTNGPLWFLGGDNPGAVFGRSGPLYHLDPTGGRLTPVTLPKRLWSVTSLAVAPDGHQIALSNGGGEFPPRNLYVMRSDGSALRRITSGNYYEVTPTWSPDGSVIVFASTRCCATAHSSGDYALYTIHPNGTGLRLLRRDTGATDISPAWPAGSWSDEAWFTWMLIRGPRRRSSFAVQDL